MLSKRRKVVLTGFGPFDKYKENVSWSAVKELAKKGVAEDVELITTQLPVVYDDVQHAVPKLWGDHQPNLVVHVGVSGVAEKITIESQAPNGTYERKDINGKCPSTKCCMEGADDCVIAGLDMNRVVDAVNNHACKASAVLSVDPGKYLCGYSFFLSLNQDRGRAAFIHVPPEGEPYTVEELAEGIREAILCMLDQVDCS